MKNLKTYILAAVGVLFVLGMAISSCDSKKVCDVATGLECQWESTCRPLLIDLIF